jgi:hypothetical protein
MGEKGTPRRAPVGVGMAQQWRSGYGGYAP